MTQRSTPEVLAWYEKHQTTAQLGFNPNGQCLKICRTARGLPGGWASAVVAQAATPHEHRVYDLAKVRPGMVMYFDDPRDSNEFGHIVTVASVAPVIKSLADIVVWTNSVVSGKVVKVRADYFPKHWGDGFQFAATWLNGEALDLPQPPRHTPPRYKEFPPASVLVWNMKVGKRVGVYQALDSLAASGARRIGLMECMGHWPVIRDWAKDRGWSIFTGEGDPGSSSAWLVKHNSQHASSGVITMKTRWKGPQFKRRRKYIPGRTIVWEKGIQNGRPTLEILAHGIWNRRLNFVANRRYAKKIVALVNAHPGYDVNLRGDLNEKASSRLIYSPYWIAKKTGMEFVGNLGGVDLVLSRLAKPGTAASRLKKPRLVIVKDGLKRGSDHIAIGTRNGASL